MEGRSGLNAVGESAGVRQKSVNWEWQKPRSGVDEAQALPGPTRDSFRVRTYPP